MPITTMATVHRSRLRATRAGTITVPYLGVRLSMPWITDDHGHETLATPVLLHPDEREGVAHLHVHREQHRPEPGQPGQGVGDGPPVDCGAAG